MTDFTKINLGERMQARFEKLKQVEIEEIKQAEKEEKSQIEIEEKDREDALKELRSKEKQKLADFFEFARKGFTDAILEDLDVPVLYINEFIEFSALQPDDILGDEWGKLGGWGTDNGLEVRFSLRYNHLDGKTWPSHLYVCPIKYEVEEDKKNYQQIMS
jgi:hypothetical protein